MTQDIKILWLEHAAYYRTDLSDETLQLYAEDLAEFLAEDVARAMQQLRREPGRRFLFLPADVRQIIEGDFPEADAQEAAARIRAAISRCGRHHPEGARKLIGEVGWEIVQLNGGWSTVCESATFDNLPTLMAQWRNLAQSRIDKHKLGLNLGPPNFVERIETNKGPAMLTDILRTQYPEASNLTKVEISDQKPTMTAVGQEKPLKTKI